eukprot:3177393-Alexandrium_andersonii.AAC.1
MSASLVGSEMCIRDRYKWVPLPPPKGRRHAKPATGLQWAAQLHTSLRALARLQAREAISPQRAWHHERARALLARPVPFLARAGARREQHDVDTEGGEAESEGDWLEEVREMLDLDLDVPDGVVEQAAQLSRRELAAGRARAAEDFKAW